jgi:hypothetical protein
LHGFNADIGLRQMLHGCDRSGACMEWASGNEILWLCAPASHLNYERDAGEGRGSTCVRA